MELTVVPIVKPDAANFIFGQSHFIKTVEDLHEALVGAVPGIRFGLAFCEASGKRLVRWSGNDEAALALARDNALAIGAGHTFLIFLGDRLAGLFTQFKSDGSTGLFLADSCAIRRVSARSDILDLDRDHVTATQLNLTRVMNIVGIKPLMAAIVA
jgi:hypothetical protein